MTFFEMPIRIFLDIVAIGAGIGVSMAIIWGIGIVTGIVSKGEK